MRQAQVRQAAQDTQQDAQPITGGAYLVGAHERGVERGDIGLHHMFGDAFSEEVNRAPFVQSQLALLLRRLAW